MLTPTTTITSTTTTTGDGGGTKADTGTTGVDECAFGRRPKRIHIRPKQERLYRKLPRQVLFELRQLCVLTQQFAEGGISIVGRIRFHQIRLRATHE